MWTSGYESTFDVSNIMNKSTHFQWFEWRRNSRRDICFFPEEKTSFPPPPAPSLSLLRRQPTRKSTGGVCRSFGLEGREKSTRYQAVNHHSAISVLVFLSRTSQKEKRRRPTRKFKKRKQKRRGSQWHFFQKRREKRSPSLTAWQAAIGITRGGST